MEDFSFEVSEESAPSETAAQAYDKEQIGVHIKEAKAALAKKQYGDYWTAVNKAAALMGAADSEEADEDITDMINQKLGGPGTES
jgi:hypothetical protein